jgi:hypothetical protein
MYCTTVSCGYVNVLYYTSGMEQHEAAALRTVLTETELTYALRVPERGPLSANVTKNCSKPVDGLK